MSNGSLFCSAGSSEDTTGFTIACCLPRVPEFSTAVKRFQNQIARSVLLELERRCRAIGVTPPGPTVLSDTTTQDQSMTAFCIFQIPAVSVNSVDISLQNVLFELVGLSSALVRVAGEAVIKQNYLGVDGETHDQTNVVPFSFLATIAGTFPAGVTVDGSLSIANTLVVNEVDPSTLTITLAEVSIFFTTRVRILLPA